MSLIILKLLKFLREHNRIAIFGTGKASEALYTYLPTDICYYTDNDPIKWGKEFNGKTICNPNVLKNENKNQIGILVPSLTYYEEIKNQLVAMGFDEDKDFINLGSLYEEVAFGVSPSWNNIYNEYRKKYNIHPSFRFNGEGVLLYGDGEIYLGENSYIGRYGRIASCSSEHRVQIGNNCRIASFVTMYTLNNIADQDFSNINLLKSYGSIIIGDHCWIGTGVYIKEGVTIGDNTVIGANSVVTKDIPCNVIAGGVPAKLIKNKSVFHSKG